MRGARSFQTSRSRRLRKDQTPAERLLWQKLRDRRLNGYKFVRQEPIGPCFADFVCREHDLVVEVDGATHWTDEERAHDRCRDAFLKSQGLRILRLTNDDVFSNLEGVCETILAAVENRTTV